MRATAALPVSALLLSLVTTPALAVESPPTEGERQIESVLPLVTDDGSELIVIHLAPDAASPLETIVGGSGPDGERAIAMADADGNHVIVSSDDTHYLPTTLETSAGPGLRIRWPDDPDTARFAEVQLMEPDAKTTTADWHKVALDAAAISAMRELAERADIRNGAADGTRRAFQVDLEPREYDLTIPFEIRASLTPPVTEIMRADAECLKDRSDPDATRCGAASVFRTVTEGPRDVASVVIPASTRQVLSSTDPVVARAETIACQDRGSVSHGAMAWEVSVGLAEIGAALLAETAGAAAAPATGGSSAVVGHTLASFLLLDAVWSFLDTTSNYLGDSCERQGAGAVALARFLERDPVVTLGLCAVTNLGEGCGEAPVPAPQAGFAPAVAPTYFLDHVRNLLGFRGLESYVVVELDYGPDIRWELTEPKPEDVTIETVNGFTGTLATSGFFDLEYHGRNSGGDADYDFTGSFTEPASRMVGGEAYEWVVEGTASGSGTVLVEINLCYSSDRGLDSTQPTCAIFGRPGEDFSAGDEAEVTFVAPSEASPGETMTITVNAGTFARIDYAYVAVEQE